MATLSGHGAVGPAPDADPAAAAKRAVGYAAAELAEPGMRIGLGTGSTTVFAIRRIAQLVAAGSLSGLSLVPTSTQTQAECWELGLNLVTLNDPAVGGSLDLAIDGADEVDPGWSMIKGAGGAMLMEKVVAYVAARYVIVVDASKLVARLGVSRPIPVEVLPAALLPVRLALESLGLQPQVRAAGGKKGPVITDNGNLILDARLPGGSTEPVDQLERAIDAIPGVVESGIFTRCVTDLMVGDGAGVRHERRPRSLPAR